MKVQFSNIIKKLSKKPIPNTTLNIRPIGHFSHARIFIFIEYGHDAWLESPYDADSKKVNLTQCPYLALKRVLPDHC
jgi:hypothetical protein